MRETKRADATWKKLCDEHAWLKAKLLALARRADAVVATPATTHTLRNLIEDAESALDGLGDLSKACDAHNAQLVRACDELDALDEALAVAEARADALDADLDAERESTAAASADATGEAARGDAVEGAVAALERELRQVRGDLDAVSADRDRWRQRVADSEFGRAGEPARG